jgi:hypothetical protein
MNCNSFVILDYCSGTMHDVLEVFTIFPVELRAAWQNLAYKVKLFNLYKLNS